ncbi:MAG TPA: homoserine kinase [Dehalococcoidia bacterium]|nr:homoserine kinase [Dehalococcoidia bacterium]
MTETVTVRVPATSANLGPGFDSLGLALTLTQDVTITLSHATQPNGGLARLVIDAVKSAYRLARVEAPREIAVSGESPIPIGRGLGASAAARAAGIFGANALMHGALTEGQMLALGAGLEGHADNMAPALFGGLRIVVRADDGWRHIALPVAAGLKVVLFVPDFEMPTGESRKLMPASLSREDAVSNIGRAAMLVAALTSGQWDALDIATHDRLHQPARTKIFPAMPEIFDAAREAGALAAYLSGGGSTIAAFAVEGEERIGRAMMQRAIALGYPGRVVHAEPSNAGASIIA